MKSRISAALAAITVLVLPSCDKSSKDFEEKLIQLEKAANDATERQRELETELADQQLATEREAIERERLQIEQDRLAMEDAAAADNAAALAELEKREQELAEREDKVLGQQENINARQQELTGLEGELRGKESALAGRAPLRALPVEEKQYVSGLPTGISRTFTNHFPIMARGLKRTTTATFISPLLCAIPRGVHTPVAAGPLPIRAGHGFQTNLSAGRPITMAVGICCAESAGSGFPEVSGHLLG